MGHISSQCPKKSRPRAARLVDEEDEDYFGCMEFQTAVRTVKPIPKPSQRTIWDYVAPKLSNK